MVRIALERPVSTFIAAATLVAIGAFSLYRLPVSFLPEIRRPQLEIAMHADGRSQEEMLHGLTLPLERRLASIPGVTSVRSETSDETTRVVLETDWQADADQLLISAARRTDNIGEITPDEQTLALVEIERSPIVEVAVLGGESASDRASYVRQGLLPEMARLSGSGRIETIGLAPLHVVVRPDVAALVARGITTADLLARLGSIGNPLSAGRVREGAEIRRLVIRDAVESLEELRQIEIPTADGRAVLADLARVTLEEVDDGTAFSLDGEPGVLLRIFRAPGANAVALAARARDRVAEFDRRTSGGIRLRIAGDRSREVVAALSQLALAGLAGILLGTLVLRLMLGTWAPTAALGIVIPASMLTAFSAFYFWGLPLNVVSIAGLALAAGMLVDNSVVVVESIESARASGARDAQLEGTRQIALAVVASAVTTIVVFLPLLYLRGLSRAFFGEQAFAIVSTLAASLLFSLTLTPVLAGRTSRPRRQRSPGMPLFLALLERVMARPWITVALGFTIMAVSLAAIATLPRDLLPPSGERVVRVRYRISHRFSSDEALRLGREVERRARGAVAGQPLLSFLAMSSFPDGSKSATRERLPRGGRIDLEFDSVETADEARERLQHAISLVPDVDARVEFRPGAFVEVVGGRGERLEIVVRAADAPRVAALAERVAETVEARTGLAPRVEERERALPVVVLRWDEARLARLGLDRAGLESQLRAALEIGRAGRVSIPAVAPEILIDRTTDDDPSGLPVGPVAVPAETGREAEDGRLVPLGALARLETGLRPAVIRREDGRPTLRLVVSRPDQAREAVDALSLERLLQGMPLAADETLRLGGEAREVSRSFSQLRLALVLSVVLVFLTLAALYESFLLPLLIMTTVPTATGGALVALAATGQTLNVLSFLGVILLGGIVVNNAIVLVQRIEQLRLAGRSEPDALRRAMSERYRPILMTTLTTLLGMLPLALLGGQGMELRRALSTAVVGGLFTATFASLLLVPALHCLLERYRGRTAPAAAPRESPR